jgi:lysophospholipase L1-like esterase
MFYAGKVTDKAGLPLAGVRVSDGRNVVLTDAEGRYQLPGWERSRVLHVGVLTKQRDDWFVCTDGKEGVYDFTLSPAPQQEDFCFLHVSDTEINGRKQLDWMDFLAKQVQLHKPAFLLNTGDLFAVEGTKRHAEECANELVGCPVRYCIGNHDFTEGDYGVFGKRGIANVHNENYPYFLEKSLGCEVLNYGKCGFTSMSYLKYYNAGNVDVSGADIVLIMLGSNGGLDPAKETQGNADFIDLISLVREDAPKSIVVLITPPHVTENPEYSNCGYISNVLKAQKFVKEVSKKLSLPLIDLGAFEEFNADTEKIYQPNDGLHFTEKGYRVMAEFIEKELKKLNLV